MRVNEIELQRYADFRPTQFDPKGLALDEQQDWLVVPVARNRDSGITNESNFESALKMLGGESDDCEVHRFGHWANGWFEIIIVRPGSKAHAMAQEIDLALANYPLLDEEDHSRREDEAACNYWDNMGMRERIRVCAKYRTSIFAARRDEIPENVDTYYLAEGC